MRIFAALARFFAQLQANGRSPHTVAQYQRHVAAFAEWAAARGLEDVRTMTPEHLAAYLGSPSATLRQDGRRRSVVTMNAMRSSLRGFFEYTERAGIVEKRPARGLRLARAERAAPKGLRADEVERLKGVMSAGTSVTARRDHALVSFLLGTGARLSSALALDVADLDLDQGTATLRELKGGGTLEVSCGPSSLSCWRRGLATDVAGPSSSVATARR